MKEMEYVNLVCANCGQPFSRAAYRRKSWPRNVYCSAKCHRASLKNSGQRERVNQLHVQHPDWSHRRIAREVGITRQWVSILLGNRQPPRQAKPKLFGDPTPLPRPRRWASLSDVAGILGLKKHMARRYIEQGLIPAHRPNPTGQWRIYYEDIDPARERISRQPKPIGISAAADILGITTGEVRNYAEIGLLTGRRRGLNRHWVFEEGVIMDFAKSRGKL